MFAVGQRDSGKGPLTQGAAPGCLIGSGTLFDGLFGVRYRRSRPTFRQSTCDFRRVRCGFG